ncbi:hypothetical protein ACFL2J_00255 [Candidatus Omnitrophota bacterium]
MRNLKLKIGTKKKRGQSIAEYMTLISIVLVALLAMKMYMTRGIQAVIKQSTDELTVGTQHWEEKDPEKGMQSNFKTDTLTSGRSRLQQENTDYGVTTTYTTDVSSSSIVGGNSWKTDDL